MSLIYIGYKAYSNYQRNKVIEHKNNYSIYSNQKAKFEKFTESDQDFESNQRILIRISGLIDSTQNEFLLSTDKKIIFNPIEVDTISIHKNKSTYQFFNTGNKEILNKRYTEVLVEKLTPILKKNKIEKIKIFTLSPTEFNNIPPPPGTLANFNY